MPYTTCVLVPDLVRICLLSNCFLPCEFCAIVLVPDCVVCTRFLSRQSLVVPVSSTPVFELVGNRFLSNRYHVPSKIGQSVAIGQSVQNGKTLGMTVLPTACGPTECRPTACEPIECGPTECGPTECGPTECEPTKCGLTECEPTKLEC